MNEILESPKLDENGKRIPIQYIDNKKFFEAILERRELIDKSLLDGTPIPQLTDYLGDCILKIANKLATKGNFVGYSYKDEMISDAIENCVRYFDKFNPEKSSNPFSYYTQIIYYAFLRRISKEKDQFLLKHKIIQSVGETVLALQDQDEREFVNGFREYLKDFSNVVLPDAEKKIRKVRDFPDLPITSTLDFLYSKD